MLLIPLCKLSYGKTDFFSVVYNATNLNSWIALCYNHNSQTVPLLCGRPPCFPRGDTRLPTSPPPCHPLCSAFQHYRFVFFIVCIDRILQWLTFLAWLLACSSMPLWSMLVLALICPLLLFNAESVPLYGCTIIAQSSLPRVKTSMALGKYVCFVIPFWVLQV